MTTCTCMTYGGEYPCAPGCPEHDPASAVTPCVEAVVGNISVTRNHSVKGFAIKDIRFASLEASVSSAIRNDPPVGG